MIKQTFTILLKRLSHSRVLFWCSLLMIQSISLSVSAAQTELKGVRTWPSPDNTRVVFDLSNKPQYETHYLTNPDRLVIDLTGTTNKANLKAIKNKGKLITDIRESKTAKANTFRLVIDLKEVSKAKIFSLPPAKPYGHRLVIDLPTIATRVPNQISATPNGRNIIVAIDAGHGGDDPGALGKYSYEKKVTLEIAKRLKKVIDGQRGMQAFLIRTGDYFVNLNKRSEIARKGKADFLVSIHADGFTSSRPKGASVWVLSNRRATTELGRWMERNEAQSELLGGAGDLIQDSDSVPFLNKMLLDMSMGNTMGVGFNIGSLVTNELSKITTMHKKEPVHASLAVLKSPDIPSILVEAGFITNRTEERLLNQAEFQNKIANAVFKGIYTHFSEKPPQGSLFAQKKRAIKHTVRSGESLSILSRRYSVSSAKLKDFNHLKSSALRIGQVLSIPENYHMVEDKSEASSQPSIAQNQKATTHVVQRGESLSIIANKYNQSVAGLVAHNKLQKTSLLVGQKIKIPGSNEPSSVVQQPVQKERTHIVKAGEALSLIAYEYNQSTAELVAYNNLKKTSLYVGQKIKIPGDAASSSSQQNQVVVTSSTPDIVERVVRNPSVHTVESGEALSLIAREYGLNTSDLVTYNHLKKTTVYVGQKIKIPGETTQSLAVQQPIKKTVEKPVIHTVKPGEALSLIAREYNKSTAELVAYNNLKKTSLYVGQKIKIPGGTVQTSVTQQPAKKVVQKPVVHTVKAGEALSLIAREYNKSTAGLVAYNNLKKTTVYVGQKIKIPNSNNVKAVEKVVKAPEPTKHKVKSGESLSVIAKRYGRSSKQFQAYNNLSSSRLLVGQTLKIPSSNYVVPTRPASHTVSSGESLSVIANKYDITTRQLKQFNNLRSNALKVGQKLKIPLANFVIKKHKVRSGESLSVIAKRYGTTTSAIMSTNKLRSKSLAIGQVLTIPVS
jgi:N-acetylmuramoyl-L-alanine amidase